mmetsp:Transcript_13889/g.19113  ORF Transcript_13889/g.19113 Transcript_13889/m.19113 type:complete len:189 (-) Transcript_13889:161-727(-)|eukprot:CAMPEP_0196581514 /NCGR_PEP_ID=MMETSP1081-20130531/34010_1 /TAXON_ID=36882 /ORGANISM="Pyramimonas amylifera, Strain CCMP720" /LENGTH=188 /DNA_ID=CAMNT_0041901771 /DNA_START=18 /DNA_END=584 /DNA_ORIENTATION=+
MANRPVRPLLHRIKHLLKSGAVREPLWYEALCRIPPEDPNPNVPKPPIISYPEDALVRDYRLRHPEANKIPVKMLSDEMHVVRKFAIRQHELMQSCYSKEEAFQLAQKEFGDELAEASTPIAVKSALSSIQSMEEEYIKEALSFVPRLKQAPVREAAVIQTDTEAESEMENAPNKKKKQQPIKEKKKK